MSTLPPTVMTDNAPTIITGAKVFDVVTNNRGFVVGDALNAHLSLQTRAFLVNFLIGGCGSGACKWRACFPAFVSSFYCKKQEKWP